MSTTPGLDTTITLVAPPPTPTVSRTGRARESNGATSPHPAPTRRHTITSDSLPTDFQMPEINVCETNRQMAGLKGRDLPTGVLLDETEIAYRKVHTGRKSNIGTVCIPLALDMRQAAVCMCLHTHPQQIVDRQGGHQRAQRQGRTRGRRTSLKDRWPGMY